jgi:hypothetical protein
MDLTKLPQELLFFEKRSIDDFDIDNELSSDGILYNRIINISLTVPVGWDKEKLLLTIFNDAYYLTTIIILDDRFSLHTHAWINFYYLKWNDDMIVSIILGMVEYYISYTADLPHHARKAADDLIEDYRRAKAANAGIGIDIFKKNIRPDHFLHREHFQTINFTNGLLRYNTFTGNVKWGPVSKNFEINDVIRLVRILGKDLQGQRLVLSDIYRDLKLDENSAFCSQELYELMEILEYQLNNTGELLNKKKLLQLYKEEQERKEEYFQAEMDAMLNGDFESQKKKYEEEIENLKKQIFQLEKEKSDLTVQNGLLTERAQVQSEMGVKLADENKELLETIDELEHQLEEKGPEKAFNAQTGNPCFTNRQMGILLTAVGRITEKDNPPGKTTLGEIVEKISGYKSTTASTNMRGTMPKADINAVVTAIESKFPNLAAEVSKV